MQGSEEVRGCGGSGDDQSLCHERVDDDASRLGHEVFTHLDDDADVVPLVLTVDQTEGAEHLAAVGEDVAWLVVLGTADADLAHREVSLRAEQHQADLERVSPELGAGAKLLEDSFPRLLREELGLGGEQVSVHVSSNL